MPNSSLIIPLFRLASLAACLQSALKGTVPFSDLLLFKRSMVAAVALGHGVRPSVDAAQPLVEGVLMKNRQTGKLAAILMNWAYRGYELEAHDQLKVRLPGLKGLTTARSTWLRQTLPVTEEGGDSFVTLPRLEDGDILLLE
jgi:hypothetical protein